MKILWSIYKKLPFSFRTGIHRVWDFFNENGILHFMVGFRHKITVRRIRRIKGPKRLIVGESYLRPGWFVTNYRVFCRNYLDATKPFAKEECVEFIYADNVIEHLNQVSGKDFMKNAYSSLMQGGRIRLATPNCEEIVRAYISEDSIKVSQMNLDFESHGIPLLDPIDMLHVTFAAFGHHKGRIYDPRTLSHLLREVGFKQIEFFQPGESNTPQLMNLEHRTKPSDTWGQMCIEAQK
jgi:predicted SAM-dependent methyltransferase